MLFVNPGVWEQIFSRFKIKTYDYVLFPLVMLSSMFANKLLVVDRESGSRTLAASTQQIQYLLEKIYRPSFNAAWMHFINFKYIRY